jgi:hypothetical protein
MLDQRAAQSGVDRLTHRTEACGNIEVITLMGQRRDLIWTGHNADGGACFRGCMAVMIRLFRRIGGSKARVVHVEPVSRPFEAYGIDCDRWEELPGRASCRGCCA